MPSLAIIGTRGYPSYYGGFETAVRKLAPYLADKGWDVTVYGRSNEDAGASTADVDMRIHRHTTWGLEKKSLSTLTYGLTSSIHAAHQRPDAALVMNVANGFWLPILKRAKIPTLVNVDGLEWEREKWGKAAKSVFRAGARFTAKYGTDLVYDSHEIRRYWRQKYSREGLYIPYGGQRPDRVLPLEPGLTHRGYVLVVARFVPENSIPEFFQAAETIAQHYEVVIVGSSGYGGLLDQQAQTLAANNRRVTWLGHINDDERLHSLWQHAGVYFHGHSVGGTNPALVQAMACGSPVVARDTVYNREVLADGMFVEPNPSEIASSILRFMEDGELLEQSARHNIKRSSKLFTWQGVNERYESALLNLLHAGLGARESE